MKCDQPDEQSDEQFQEQSNDQTDKAMITALRFICYQPRTALEVRQRLERGGFGRETSEKTVAECVNQQLLDDLKYALMYISEKMRTARHGRARIAYSLRQKGVANEVITEAYAIITQDPQRYIESDSLEQAEYDSAVYLITNKYGGIGVKDTDTPRKAADYLHRRGFSRDVIKLCLKSLIRK